MRYIGCAMNCRVGSDQSYFFFADKFVVNDCAKEKTVVGNRTTAIESAWVMLTYSRLHVRQA